MSAAMASLFLGGSHHGERYTTGTEAVIVLPVKRSADKGPLIAQLPKKRPDWDVEQYERRSVRFHDVARPIRIYVIKKAGGEHDTAALLAAFLEGRAPHV